MQLPIQLNTKETTELNKSVAQELEIKEDLPEHFQQAIHESGNSQCGREDS